MQKVISIVGARPQFIKHAPMQVQLEKYFQAITLHTGQHFDAKMSAVFFDELKISKPQYLLENTKSSNHGEQTGLMLIEIEKIFMKEKPDFIIVYGDTNSTLAGTLAAVKLHIPVVHIEAGLRSYNREMPEEINRIVSDSFSTLLFCPSQTAVDNLCKEGITHDGVIVAGDVMIDTIELVKPTIKRLADFPYYFATLHRPYNTDSVQRLVHIIEALNALEHKVIFPVHPRTRKKLFSENIDNDSFSNIIFTEPCNYLESLSYQYFAESVITDSGGMQKEAYHLKKKCITIRSETEWVETLKDNWNTLVFDDLSQIASALKTPTRNHIADLYGDGNSASGIVDTICKHFSLR